MKKVLIGLAIFFGIMIFMYGSISTLVNQGLSLVTSLVVFFLVILGGAGLVWLLKDQPKDEPPAE